jgi:hypothetical protein
MLAFFWQTEEDHKVIRISDNPNEFETVAPRIN